MNAEHKLPGEFVTNDGSHWLRMQPFARSQALSV